MKKLLLAMVGILALWTGTAAAHHSFAAEFDIRKPVSLSGTIGKLDWINPHAYVYLDVKDAGGTTARWAFQTLPPSMMRVRGVNRDMFAIGQTVTISGFGAKDGTKNLGWIKRVTYGDGKVLQVTADGDEDKVK
jgi:Family of unknown function (DUF6152)